MPVIKLIYRYFLLFFLFMPVLLHAQGVDKTTEAHAYFQAQAYQLAMPLFAELCKENPNDPSLNFYYAASMVEAGKITDETFKRLKLAVESGHFAEGNYYAGEAYRKTYRFDEAITAFNTYLKSAGLTPMMEDKTNLQINACQNGKNMLNYAYEPQVAGRIKAPVNVFYLYCQGLEAGAFAERPAAMKMKVDSVNSFDYPSVVFFPKADSRNADVIYFSSYGLNDKTGLDIYCIRRIEGDKWGEPENLGSQINTPFDEDFPYVTEDGKTLYFASKGHYSMGGYDIYKSKLDPVTKTWGEPENLGFPYSSPYDDILYVPDSKGEYVYFASQRAGEQSNLTVYKLAQEVNPLNSPLTDITAIGQIARLNVGKDEQTDEEPKPSATSKTQKLDANPTYKAMVKQTGLMNAQLSKGISELENLRHQWDAAEEGEQRDSVGAKLLAKEQENTQLRSQYDDAIAQVNDAQYNFITNGVLPLDSALIAQVGEDAQPIPAENTVKAGDTFGKPLARLSPLPIIKMTPPKPVVVNS